MRKSTSAGWLLLGCALSGCLYGVTTTGTGGTLPSGRTVTANSDRSMRSIRCEAVDEATESVTIGALLTARKIEVKPTEVVLDGLPVAIIPETTKSVTVAEEKGRLKITADDREVYNGSF